MMLDKATLRRIEAVRLAIEALGPNESKFPLELISVANRIHDFINGRPPGHPPEPVGEQS